jgi:hypothetical protein
MTLDLQKYLRLMLPGVFLYGLLVVFCSTTNWCELAIPASWEEATKLVTAVVLGALYSFTGLRKLSNGPYHLDVNQNIIDRLTLPFKGDVYGVQDIKWPVLKDVFYYFIDRDETLKTRASIIRFNGLLWTSAADLRAAAMLGIFLLSGSAVCSKYSSILNLATLKFEEARIGVPIFLLSILFVATFWASYRLTKKHKDLGADQCSYILLHYRDDLKTKLVQAAMAAER